MGLMCKLFGHVPSKSRLRRDPETFVERTECRRCDCELVQRGGKWRADRSGST
jgi:hypothetical protein